MILDGDPFNGFLVDENPSVSAITINTNYINQYVVPSGKRLYLTSGTSIFVDINDPNQSMPGVGNAVGKPLIFNSGESIHSNGDPFNGYLVDENYFANCGGGGSSNARATIDSLSQVVSYLDSALTALTSLVLIVEGCTDPYQLNYNPLANTDNGSCVPFSYGCTDSTGINYDANANTDDGSCIVIGSFYQGGIIFYLNGSGGGLVAAPNDQVLAPWGCYGTTIGTSPAFGTGYQNTININSGCTTPGIAADICYTLTLGGYSDWFLPSKNELNEMYLNLHQQGFGGFANNSYWSSTEIDFLSSYIQNFGSGSSNYTSKNNPNSVRAIRAF